MMWDELCASAEACQDLCTERLRCVKSYMTDQITCRLFSQTPRNKNILEIINFDQTPRPWNPELKPATNLPPESCRTMDKSCDCRKGGVYRTIPFTRKETCARLHNQTILFTGDSLVRDVWTTFALWLLVEDGIDVQQLANVENHVACFFQAWKMLRYMGLVHYLQEKKKLYMSMREELNLDYDGRLFVVCNGNVRLIMFSENQLAMIQSNVPIHINKIKPSIWVVGAGVHNMVEQGDSLSALKEFSTFLNTKAETTEHLQSIIYIGTHYRHVERTPKPYLDYAKGPQGNVKIKKWNQLMNDNAKSYVSIDPWNYTKNVVSKVDWYRDTEDGFHMGYFINLQKVQMVIEKITMIKNDNGMKKNVKITTSLDIALEKRRTNK